MGPKLAEEERVVAEKEFGRAFPSLDIPSLDIAVVVLDPNLDEDDDQMRNKGISPEVCKTISMRSACLI